MEETLFENVVAQYNKIIVNRFNKEKIFDLMEIDTPAAQNLVQETKLKQRKDLFEAVSNRLNQHYDMIHTKDYFKIMADENSPVCIFGKIRGDMLLNDFSLFPLLELSKE